MTDHAHELRADFETAYSRMMTSAAAEREVTHE